MEQKIETPEYIKRAITGCVLALAVYYITVHTPAWTFCVTILGCLALMLVQEWPRFFSPRSWRFWVYMPIYPSIPLVLLCILRIQAGAAVVLFLFLATAVYDTGSYVVGKLWGTRKLCPTLSPGKSWQGLGGGLAATGLLNWLVLPSASWLFIVSFTVVFCCAALTGDLFESYLKRRVGLKDSGALLPGHGGLFDRLDALMFTVVIVYVLRTQIASFLNLV